jgi:hypothetical protein
MVAVVLVFLCLAGGLVIGQVLYGNLVGNVTDPQQAAVIGAVVTIRNNATGYTTETKSGDRGTYEIRNIPPGVYEIKISASGLTLTRLRTSRSRQTTLPEWMVRSRLEMSVKSLLWERR